MRGAKRQESLRHRDRADHIDLKLLVRLLDGYHFHRPSEDDAGAVDQPSHPGGPHGGLDTLCGGSDGCCVGHVQQQWSQSRGGAGLEGLAFALAQDARENAISLLVSAPGRRPRRFRCLRQ